MGETDWEAGLDRQEMARAAHLEAAGVNIHGIPDDFDPPDLISLGAIWHARMQDGETWTDRKGIKRNIDQMEASHRENVRRFLRKHCKRLEHVTSLYALAHLAPDDQGEHGHAVADWMIPQTPLEWLYSTPLFLALDRADSWVADDPEPTC